MPNLPFGKRLAVAWDYVMRGKARVTTFSETGWETPSYSPVIFESMVSHGYRKNELIFACISKTANTAAQIALQVRAQQDGPALPNHPLKQLIQRPNPYMSEFDFWAAVTIYQKLAARAIFEKERNNGGKVIRLWPLRPDWVKVVAAGPKDPRPGIVRYEYCPPGLKPQSLNPSDVVDFPLFDPLGYYAPWPPVAVAARVGDADNAATDHIKGTWEKGGVPVGLLKTTQRLGDAQVTDIRRRWKERYGGHENWYEPAVLDSDAEYQKIGLDFKELGFDVLDARSEARICMVLDIPPILVGAKIGLDRATYSNYGEARRAWWEDSLLPMYANNEDVLYNQLAGDFGQVYLAWDTSRVPALQEERNSRWTRATAALGAGGITVNEFCAEVGLPDKGQAGNLYIRSSGTVEVDATIGIREEPEPPEPAAEDTPADDQEDAGEDSADETPGAKSTKAKQPPDNDLRQKHERKIKAAMQEFFAGQLGRIESALRAAKALTPDNIGDSVFWDSEDEALFKVLFPKILEAAMAGAEVAAQGMLEMGVGVDWALVNQVARKWAREYTYNLVKGIDKTTREALQAGVSDWIASGLPLDDLINSLAATFGANRADLIGITETTRAFAEGNQATWRESGVVSGKRWMTAQDELVCPICGDTEAGPGLVDVVAPLDGSFSHPTTGEEYPIPPAHPRCRCWIQPVIGGAA